MIRFRTARLGPLLLAVLLGGACDGSTTSPVAPKGTVIVIEASPKTITVTGSSIITVTLLHGSGVPAREGTEVLLTTTLGTIETSPVVTDSRGVARTVLRADGRAGTATVTAISGVKTMGDETAPNSKTVDVAIGGGDVERLVAKFTAETDDSLTVRFDESSDGNPTSWHWNFGDGAESTQREPTHTYPSAGTYRVTLTVRDADGQDAATQSVVVPKSQEIRPMASFTPEVTGLRVTFTDTSENNPTSWHWTFGDGASSTAQSPVHIYAAPRVYTVTLTAGNAAGEDSTSQSIVVPDSEAPVADFEAQEVESRRVLFRDKSTNAPTSWEWSFGDGTSSSLQNPEHTYAAAGTYTVTLVASNLAGRSTKTEFVEVKGLVADFEFSASGLVVSFTDTSDGRPDEYAWKFDDGETSSERNPVHTYPEAGRYTVTLEVTFHRLDGEPETDSVSKLVVIPE